MISCLYIRHTEIEVEKSYANLMKLGFISILEIKN